MVVWHILFGLRRTPETGGSYNFFRLLIMCEMSYSVAVYGLARRHPAKGDAETSLGGAESLRDALDNAKGK